MADQELVSNQFCQVVLEDRKLATRTEKAWDPGQFARSAVGRRETELASWATRERFLSKRFLHAALAVPVPSGAQVAVCKKSASVHNREMTRDKRGHLGHNIPRLCKRPRVQRE